MNSQTRCWLAVLLAFAAIVTTSRSLSQGTLTEAQAKAAFVVNFARYIEWPERAFTNRTAPLLICALGRSVVGNALEAHEGRQVQGRPVAVRQLLGIDEARPCQVLFIADSEERRMSQLLRVVAAQPILTVSDADAFIDSGGAIGLVRADQRLQFEVNRQAIEQAQLKASSNLLKLARNLADFKGSH
ncbi:YfiR family protein [Accumulibacter sp.]|uniref:YfiR family protein n=1 Tax=Accumulibacter sp. TaxID=2053492 RepID=UPI0028C44437|nr:YfiR family protein [Accumulibacter sp.]